MTSDADRIIGLYERHAEAFDRERGKNLFERDWLDLFLSHLAGTDVLDIGCGSGEPVAAYLIGRNCAVTGVDSSERMIGMCRARFPAHTWFIADMRRLDLGRTFHGLIVWDSFFHLTRGDQRAMFAVFGAHAAPGAVLMFTSGPSDGEAIGAMWGERVHHASLAPEEYRALLAEYGFDVIAHKAEDPDCGGHTIWLAKRHS